MSSIRLRARWVFPISSPPIEDGVVEVANGIITAIHTKPDSTARNLGIVALLPGLVNAHTHLEFSDLSSPLEPAEPFTEWIRALVDHRRSREHPPKEIIADGFAEATRTGTRVIGEIATEGWSPEVFRPTTGIAAEQTDADCRVVVFRELLGLLPERQGEQLAIARQHLSEADATEQPLVERGLSPHAPYSVHPELFQRVVELCREYDAPLAMHLAETSAELELLSQGTGEFVEMLSAFGVWREGLIPRGSRILDYLEPLTALPRGLVIHGNYLTDVDIAFLAKHPQLSVVYCPRTHEYFGHADHPWPKLLAAGVRVALGTDSRGSNPDLNVWNEVRFLQRKHPKVPPEQWINWATREGAIALYGPETRLGTLQVGHPACFAVIPLTNPDATEPYAALF